MKPITFDNIKFGVVVRAEKNFGGVKKDNLYVVVGYNKPGPRDTNGFNLHVSSYHFHDRTALGGSTHLHGIENSMNVPADAFHFVAPSIEAANVSGFPWTLSKV